MEVDLLVHEPARREEHLERRQARLEQRQAPVRDERVPAQPLDVDGSDRDAGQVGVAPDVVEVVDGEHARQQRLEPAHPARHRRVGEGRLRDEERDPGRIDRLVVGQGVALGDGPRRAAQAADEAAQLALDDQLREVLVGQALAGRPAGVRRRREGRQHVVVEEMRERSVPDVVEQPGHPERLDDQALGRDRLAGRRERRAQARVERARPQAGLVHDPEPVREARVLRGREDPPGALELADPAQALEPGRVEQVLLGDAPRPAARPRRTRPT